MNSFLHFLAVFPEGQHGQKESGRMLPSTPGQHHDNPLPALNKGKCSRATFLTCGVFYFEAVFGQMVLSAWFVARFCTAPHIVLQLLCSRFYSAWVAAIPQKAPRSQANTISTRATLPPIRHECIIAVSFFFLFPFLFFFFFFFHIPASSSREGNISTLEPLAKCC